MTKRERVMAAIAGADTDRVPFSFWYHFPGGDRADEAFVRNEVEFAERYDVDLLKVMHDAPFDLPGGAMTVDGAEVFAKLPVIDPTTGNFGKHLDALKAIKERLPDDRPMVDTVFDPFAFGDKITGRGLVAMMKDHPEEAKAGLESITQSLVKWADCCLDVIDGIFLACGAASEDTLDAAAYEEFILPLDIRVMEEAARKGTANCLHVHGKGNLHFDLLARCPVNIVNWSDRTTDVSLADGRKKLPDTCLSGGINEVTAGDVSPQEIADQVKDAVGQLGGTGMLVACGCAVPTDTAAENLTVVKSTIESL
ncbi:MAG: hypothetical protein GF320_06875 [Armatimonadia bacterium]|nr:hypothetical protein [Armatimonadia bacterium]